MEQGGGNRISDFGVGILKDARSFYGNTLVRFSLLAAAVLQFAGFALLAFFVRPQQSIVIVHYNVYFGVDLIGDWGQVFIVPFVSLAFVCVNTVLAQWFHAQKERVASYALLLASVLIGLGSVFACSSIALINY